MELKNPMLVVTNMDNITFNYKDGSKTITLAEVEGSDLSVLGAFDGAKQNQVVQVSRRFVQQTA